MLHRLQVGSKAITLRQATVVSVCGPLQEGAGGGPPGGTLGSSRTRGCANSSRWQALMCYCDQLNSMQASADGQEARWQGTASSCCGLST